MPYFQQQRQRQARERRKAMVKYTNLIFALSTFTGSLPPYYRIHRGEEEGGRGEVMEGGWDWLEISPFLQVSTEKGSHESMTLGKLCRQGNTSLIA